MKRKEISHYFAQATVKGQETEKLNTISDKDKDDHL